MFFLYSIELFDSWAEFAFFCTCLFIKSSCFFEVKEVQSSSSSKWFSTSSVISSRKLLSTIVRWYPISLCSAVVAVCSAFWNICELLDCCSQWINSFVTAFCRSFYEIKNKPFQWIRKLSFQIHNIFFLLLLLLFSDLSCSRSKTCLRSLIF